MRIVVLSVIALILSNCSTGPKSSGPATDIGVWQGKVLVTNLTTKKKKWVNVQWASDSENDRMRVNVSAIMDYPVATFLRREGQNDLWLFLEKKHYSSSQASQLFNTLIKFSLDPTIFYSLLGNPRSPGDQWSCKKTDQLMSCKSTQLKTKFTVDYEETDFRKIKVYNGGKLLQLKLSRSKVQVDNRLFQPLSTSQFKTIEI